MKKLFTLIAALMAVVVVNATVVTLNPSDFTAVSQAAVDQTVKGIKMVITQGNISADQIRIYKDKTITLSSENEISGIVFTCTASGAAQYGPGCFAEQTGYTVKATKGTWVGNATSVSFTASGAQVRATKIEVYLDGEVPAEDTWVPDTVTVTEAAALIAASDAHDHFVKGVVMGQPFITYSNFGGKVSFWMNDVANPNDTIEFFDGHKGKDGEKWASLAEAQETLRVGDTILVYAGVLASYTDSKTSRTFNEIAGGYYVETLGKNPNPPVIAGPDTITVAKAVEIAQALAEPSASGQSTTDTKEYVVLGYAVSVYDKNTDGTWSFYMHDQPGQKGDFYAGNTSTDEDVAVGDLMYVRGYIAKRKTNNGNIQLQIYKGTGVHVDAGVVPDTISAAEAKAAAEALEVGAFSAKLVIDCYVAKIQTEYNEEFGNVSVWLTDDPTSTYGDIQAYRASISAEDGPSLASGDHILVEGRLSHTVNAQDNTKHYYQVAQGAQITVVEKAQGIENVVLTEKAQKVMVDGVVYIIRDNKMFDVMGTQVR